MSDMRTPAPGDLVLYQHRSDGPVGAIITSVIDPRTVRLIAFLDLPTAVEWNTASPYDPTGQTSESWRWKTRDLAEVEYRTGAITLDEYLDRLSLPKLNPAR